MVALKRVRERESEGESGGWLSVCEWEKECVSVPSCGGNVRVCEYSFSSEEGEREKQNV